MFANITQYQQISHKKHSVSGFRACLGPARGKRLGGFSRLESPCGERGMVAPQGDMVVSALFLGNVRFVPLL